MKHGNKLVQGFGINDADYVVSKYESWYEGGKRKLKILWQCPYYVKWRSMLNRCYSARYHKNKPTYIGCYVCEEWLTFSNFKAWMETQDWEGKQLDKDLLVEGNKEYGPNFCVFISRELNLFLTDRKNFRGSWPIGVHFHKPSQKFISQLRHGGTQINLGSYDTPEEAHAIWKEGKLRLTVELAAKESDARIKLALLSKYRDGGCN